jgi:glucose-6-phosphate isomerase
MTRPETDTGWAVDEQRSAIEVTASGAASLAVGVHAPALVRESVASRIGAADPTVWGPQVESEASIRLSWVGLAESSRPMVEQILLLRAELAAEGIDRIVVCGMGGSSLAPEVIARTEDVPLVVLDGTDPAQVRSAISTAPERTAVVISSKSGSTVETDSQRRAFLAAFRDSGIAAERRMIVVTDPGSALERTAGENGYRAVFTADPHVGGRFSALSAFGLVPSGLAGADISRLLDEASVVSELLTDDSEGNPGLILGSALGGTDPLRDKIVLVDEDSGMAGFADWAEQLVAESTGKNGTGLLPVVVGDPRAPEVSSGASDVLVVRLVAPETDPAPGTSESDTEVTVAGPLGAQFLLWEYAVTVAGRLLGINPFDQPDVESAKKAARGLLDERPAPAPAELLDGTLELRGTPGLLESATDLDTALTALVERLGPRGYLAVMAYLDRERDTALAGIRPVLAERIGRPVTFGWGPRFLHSTGQLHKGGPPVGVYLQITGETEQDLPVPDRPFSFGELIGAQAAGDAQVLAAHGRPVLQVHLTRRAAGLDSLLRFFGLEREAG